MLKPFYDAAQPLSWLLIRLTIGLMLLPPGIPELMAGIASTAASALEKLGIGAAEALAIVLITVEAGGGPFSLDRKIGKQL